MFTGIIEEVGVIKKFTSQQLIIEAKKVLDDAKIGDSIAVNGVCLTIEKIQGDLLHFHVSHTTLARTALSLKQYRVGSLVNLERAALPTTRLGGHLVSGHVDEAATIINIQKKKDDFDIEIMFSKELSAYIIPRSSVTIDGISLTVAQRKSTSFLITVIPHTMEVTTLNIRRVYDKVNLEVDMIGRFVVDSQKYKN